MENTSLNISLNTINEKGQTLRKAELAVFKNQVPLDTVLNALIQHHELKSDQTFLKNEVKNLVDTGQVVAVVKNDDTKTLLIQVQL
jgi:hypothetical protein